MKDEEAKRVSINYCLRDTDISNFENLCAMADPGQWRVVDGKVVRYGGAPLERPGSLALMAEAVSVIPNLIRGVRALEDALRSAWAEALSWKNTTIREREQHEQDIARTYKGETGPDRDLEILIEAVMLRGAEDRPGSTHNAEQYRRMVVRDVKEWARGVSIQAGRFGTDIEHARSRAAEEKRIRAEVDEAERRDRAEIRALLEELRLTKREKAKVAERVKDRVAKEGS